MKLRSTLAILVMLTMVLVAIGASASTVRAEDKPPLPVTHQRFNGLEGPITQDGDGRVSVSDYRNPSSPICSTQTSNAANVNTDCEGNAPHNETSIAVDPTNPNHLVGSANDYQLRLSSGGTVYETVYSRAHVSFDAGKTWTTYPVPFKNYTSTGDPAVSFDADGTVYLATLGFLWSQNRGCCINPDILVSHSTDGGKTWSKPWRVAAGSGTFSSVGTLNDKEFLTAWGHGNAIVTWTRFNDGIGGSYISSPIYASVTHDGGNTWSAPAQISGSAAFCVGAQGGTACNQDQGSVPVVAADGKIYVAFFNYSNDPSGRDRYLVVRVDPTTGHRVAGPYMVGGMYDGFTDYPYNIDGRPTYQDSQFRTWAAGNLAADPTNAAHLAVIWSDMRNSALPAPSDPYAAVTNSDIIVSQSFNGGVTWSAPAALPAPGDQFMPWGAYDVTGKLRIGYFDRSYDPANHAYGYTLATETAWGTLSFSKSQMTTALSDPTKNTRWFSGRTPNPAFPHPATFLGDYSGIAAHPAGGAVGLWTDLRVNTCFAGRCGSGENAFFAAVP
ncbi:MAG TPA: sialidase family protein [Anaerolineales bacterium]